MTETLEDHDTSTTQSGEPTTGAQAEATKRFRVVSFIQRTGSRAQKRAVATGKATKTIAGKGVSAAWDQIVVPYSGLKLGLASVGLVAGAITLWYLALMAFVVTLVGTGSIILGILACAVAYVVLARIYMVALNLGMTYFGNAQAYRMQAKGVRTVQVRHASGPLFAT